jgi:hypothetical protein
MRTAKVRRIREGLKNIRKRNDKFNRMGRLDRDQESSYGESQDALEDATITSNQQDLQNQNLRNVLPLAVLHPTKDLI